jgi:hypothetical protein
MFIETKAEQEFLGVSAAGSVSMEALKQSFLEILEAVIKQKFRKVLFDGRGLFGKFTELDLLHYTLFMASEVRNLREAYFSQMTRFAYVLKPRALDLQRLCETIPLIRGMNLKAFENLEEALKWLEVTANHESKKTIQ